MFTIGLTGGIGSGKSTVTQLFQTLAITIISADKIAKQLLTPDSVAYQAVIQQFGNAILDEHAQLNRQQLRHIIFNNPQARKWLEALLHPLIAERITQQALQATSAYCIIEIPLLIETLQPLPLIQRILVVDCDEATQILRTIQRDHLKIAEIKKIMRSQASRQQRQNLADDILENDSDLSHLKLKVDQLHQKYLILAANLSGHKR